MPLYEFRCRTCDDTFEVRRSMAESNEPASCPSGHHNAVKLLFGVRQRRIERRFFGGRLGAGRFVGSEVHRWLRFGVRLRALTI